MGTRRTLTQRSETFGFGARDPWALPAIRLLFSAPRVFEPLAEAWDRRYGGTLSALARLTESGFAAHQGPVIVDTVAGELSLSSSRAVARYRATSKARRLSDEAESDIRVMSDLFTKANLSTLSALVGVLGRMSSSGPRHARGWSVRRIAHESGMSERVARAWIARLVSKEILVETKDQYPDTVEVVPAHWRPRSVLVSQMKEIVSEPRFALLSHLSAELALSRRRELPPLVIDPSVYAGSTDYDHDVRSQAILARLITDVRKVPLAASVRIEPSFLLAARPSQGGFLVTREAPSLNISYRPDAEFREYGHGSPARAVLEYERMQTRRDAWGHIEKFAAMLQQESFPFEEGVLRFVVEGRRRVHSYRILARAYASYVSEFPDAAPTNTMRIEVADASEVLCAEDPFSPEVWFSVVLKGSGTEGIMVHDRDDSPYDDFFTRKQRRG